MMINGNLKLKRSMKRAGSYDEWIEAARAFNTQGTQMKQLTGLDVSFLLMETPNTYGHVNGLSIYDRPSADFDPFAAVRERYGIMVGHLEPLRRKAVEVPFELDRPYWVDDDNFDLNFHVRHIGLAPPGAADQLAEQVAKSASTKSSIFSAEPVTVLGGRR